MCFPFLIFEGKCFEQTRRKMQPRWCLRLVDNISLPATSGSEGNAWTFRRQMTNDEADHRFTAVPVTNDLRR